MENFTSGDALNIIKTALQSGSIKLIGPHSGEPDKAKKTAAADAAYLVELLNRLQQTPTP